MRIVVFEMTSLAQTQLDIDPDAIDGFNSPTIIPRTPPMTINVPRGQPQRGTSSRQNLLSRFNMQDENIDQSVDLNNEYPGWYHCYQYSGAEDPSARSTASGHSSSSGYRSTSRISSTPFGSINSGCESSVSSAGRTSESELNLLIKFNDVARVP